MSDTDLEALSRGVSRDMTPKAIARRLEIASQLYELALALARATPLGRVEPEPAKDSD